MDELVSTSGENRELVSSMNRTLVNMESRLVDSEKALKAISNSVANSNSQIQEVLTKVENIDFDISETVENAFQAHSARIQNIVTTSLEAMNKNFIFVRNVSIGLSFAIAVNIGLSIYLWRKMKVIMMTETKEHKSRVAKRRDPRL